jgi:NAD(P)-dependent dehydrogenase (short-subunit alcohol dehydrogenase family)
LITPTNRLAGQRCLITGGTRGLGLAMACAFAREGARVAITYLRNAGDAAEAAVQVEKAGCKPLVFQGSVSDALHVKGVVKALTEAWGGIDVLVNNAGITQVLPIALVEESDWDAVMDTNVKGAYLYSRAVVKGMIKARRGHILNIGSFASERIIEAPVHFAASKSALRGFTEALCREVGKYGVHVNLLSPGLLDVGLATMLPPHRIEEYLDQVPLKRTGTAAELAEVAVFLVSAGSAFMTGAKVVVDGGL